MIFSRSIVYYKMFLNRLDHMSKLKLAYSRSGKQLVIVYGPHGSGKTELIKQIIPFTRFVYLVPSGYNQRDVIHNLWKQVLRYGFNTIIKDEPKTPKDFFQIFQEMAVSNRLLIIIDEFDFIQQYEPSLAHDFRIWWLGLPPSTNIMFLLISPFSSVFETISKRDRQNSLLPDLVLSLGPLKYRDSLPLVAGYLPKDAVITYSVFGKYPDTLSKIAPDTALQNLIKREILSQSGSLFDLPLKRLIAAGKHRNKCVSVLECISNGIATPDDISESISCNKEEVSQILTKVLLPLGFIEKSRPILDSIHSRNFKYIIPDNFTRFWFRFVSPMRNDLLLGNQDKVLSMVTKEMNDFITPSFSEIAIQHLSLISGVNLNHPSLIGSWWSREGIIDGVAIANEENKAYFMAAEWSDKPVNRETLTSLIRKASLFPWKKSDRKDVLVLYSASGFRFDTDEALLVSLNRMQRDLDST